ncbi:hypothetical protein T4D_12324 [Trichinella pseudospiralis]|uniref:Uncharacterized protein n=1 Tax=Trichinella pseudospiralis TaxID=6337 RepID=A0A0V1G1B0_TRIPS|nr:hypothetical protein T4D_12324 [Trichinella pseudospiralis]
MLSALQFVIQFWHSLLSHVFTDGDFVKEDEQRQMMFQLTGQIKRLQSVRYDADLSPGKQLSDGTAEEDGDQGEENLPVTPLSKIAESGRCWDLALVHECKERNDVAERFQN